MKNTILLIVFLLFLNKINSALPNNHRTEKAIAIKNSVSSSPASVQDSLALVALYIQCKGVNWTKKNNWLTGTLDTWQGVTVENGRVVSLDLSDLVTSVGLTGSLPNELSNLTEIRTINLANNQLTGNLPVSWSALVKLELLNLQQNQFAGTLPSEWSALINLRWISLLLNQLSGNLPSSWSAMVNLGSIYLGENQLTGTLPTSWSALINLDTLILENNQLSGTLPNSWSSLVKLAVFSLGGNQLTGTLPTGWSTLVNLYLLNLSNNHFTGTLPDSWSAFIKLGDLCLTYNQFTGSFPASWAIFFNMKQLQISNNQLSGFPHLLNFTSLELLGLENNLFDFGDIEPNVGISSGTYTYSPQAPVGLTETITKNPGDEFRISAIVGGQSNLYQWYKNGISIQGANQTEFVIPAVTLTDAGVYTCKITNSVATQLTLESNPKTLQIGIFTPSTELDSLALVALYNQCNGVNWTKKNNWLVGRLSTWQGVTVENGRVVELNLSDRNNPVGLSGQLPGELANLSMIRSIDLGWNNLSGSLPESWRTMVNLEYLNLIYNNISGSLPTSWSTMVNLKYFLLDENKLSGSLPPEWSTLINLNVLGLTNNLISGVLPPEWSALVNLVRVELWENKISGSLPESWSTMVHLQRLDLGSNQLPGNQREGITGNLPESWSAFTELQWLNLSGNKLRGIVPESWKSMTKLTYLALNNNQITGLPIFSTLSNLEYMDVGMNLLDFGDIEPNIGIPIMNYNYAPQGLIGDSDSIVLYTGAEFKISVEVGGTSSHYQWFKNNVIIPGQTGNELIIPSVSLNDEGNYHCKITNTVATQLTLTSYIINLQVRDHTVFADAGPDQSVQEGTVVTLDGSASSVSTGKILTYKWTAPPGVILSTETDARPTFTAPEINKDTIYTFLLVVNDGTIDSQVDQVEISVLNVNKEPVANAGSDQTILEGTFVTLDGSGSFSSDNKTLTYHWISPSEIILSSDSEARPTFTVPEVKADTSYIFSLIVSDGILDSKSDEVRISVLNTNKLLLINAGPDQFVYERSIVSLDGSASIDLNEKPLKFKWTAPSEIILSSLTDAKPSFLAPDVNKPQSYTFSLVVNDGMRDSPVDLVTVTVLDVIRVYPNITTGIVNIEFNAGNGHETEILVTNLTGLELLRKEIRNPSLFQLDLSTFADETYIIQIKYETKHYAGKVILRKR